MNLIDPSFGEPALLLKRGGWCGFLDKAQGINNHKKVKVVFYWWLIPDDETDINR